MNEDEALAKLAALVEHWEDDPEESHSDEDVLLVEALEAAGWVRFAGAVRANWNIGTHWYA